MTVPIALTVRGDSMLDPLGKYSYADGDIIFVDPERTPGPGDRCVVRLDDRDEATFKQLVMEDGRRLLKALNPEWKPATWKWTRTRRWLSSSLGMGWRMKRYDERGRRNGLIRQSNVARTWQYQTREAVLNGFFAPAVAAALVCYSSGSSAEDEPVHLLCKGTVSTSVDTVRAAQKQSVIDVTLELPDKTMWVDGAWGCTATLFEPKRVFEGWGVAVPVCDNRLPIKVYDSLIKYYYSAEGEIGGLVTFELNRYSGVLRTTSVAQRRNPKPNEWVIYMTEGSFQCEQRAKQF